MNKFLSMLVLLICTNLATMFAQNTTLEVDNQYPGWLSNKIPFKDQASVQNLTVTGYINGTDVKFIRELMNNRQLSHLDLSDGKRVRDAAFFLIIMLVTFAATLLKPQKYVSSRTIQKCVEHVSTST